VGENGVDQFLLRRLQVHRNDEPLNELRDFGTDHVCAKKLSNGRVENSFHEPPVFTEGDRPAVPGERKPSDADIVPSCLRRGFREADTCDLWPAVSAPGNPLRVNAPRRDPSDCLDAGHPFVLGLVREHWRAGDIAYRIQAGNACSTAAIRRDRTAIKPDAQVFKAKILGISLDARGDDNCIRRQLFRGPAALDSRGKPSV
jgi:hypothetical protein